MAVDKGAIGADVKFRAPDRRHWIKYFVYVGISLALAAGYLANGQPWLSLLWLALGCGSASIALQQWNSGVDLTPQHAIVRGFRRRNVPWQGSPRSDRPYEVERHAGGWTHSRKRGVSDAASSDEFVAEIRCPVRARLPPHRPVLARTPWRVLASCSPRGAPATGSGVKRVGSPGRAPRDHPRLLGWSSLNRARPPVRAKRSLSLRQGQHASTLFLIGFRSSIGRPASGMSGNAMPCPRHVGTLVTTELVGSCGKGLMKDSRPRRGHAGHAHHRAP
jgi:hypothetical protein